VPTLREEIRAIQYHLPHPAFPSGRRHALASRQ
jgi:hypothetical protein